MNIIVCGGRNFNDQARVWSVLDQLHRHTPFSLLIEGGAMGADYLAYRWAVRNGVRKARFDILDSDIKLVGSTMAPRKRNHRMLAWLLHPSNVPEDQPKAVIAFPGGPGTQHMIEIAENFKVPVIRTWLLDKGYL